MKRNYTPSNEWEEQYLKEYNRIKQAIRRQQKLGYVIPKEVQPKHPSEVKHITPTDVESLIKLTPKEIRKHSVWIDKDTGEGFKGLDVVNSHHKPRPSIAQINISTGRTTGGQESKQKDSKTTKKTNNSGGAKTPNSDNYTPPKDEKLTTPKEDNYAPPLENNLNRQIIDTISSLLDSWHPVIYWRGFFLERKTTNYHKISALWKETLENEDEYEVAYRLESHSTELINLVERLLYASDSAVDDDFNMSRFIELLIGRPLTAFESDMYSEMAREQAMDTLRGEDSVG